ncbi:hypothetical protein [Pelosinus sp. UFO1]|uniref:hypothetical protein n=1 Tax=Pelosinus sp. UFO1 TaxID=484770 RepID=UPI0004D0D340|nr:hypothetical protein [Pelosinus sp. UFO1]AIF51166.1 hypothetical protein UFO1_1615 [Pelosinus sp. UFO1]
MDKKLKRFLKYALVTACIFLAIGWYMQYCNNPNNYFTIATQQWWQNVLLNIGAGLLTTIAVIFFYDMVLLKNSEKDKIFKSQIALNSLYKVLDDHFRHVLYAMYRSSALQEKEFNSLDDFFSDEYFKEIEYLDFNKSPYLNKDDERQDEVEEYSSIPRNYKIVLDYNKRLAEYLLNEVLMAYGQFLEADISEVLQEIRFSPFILYSYNLPSLTKWHSQSFFKMLRPLAVNGSIAPNGFDIKENEELIEALKKHVNLFKQIVSLYNKYAPPEKKFTFEKASNGVIIEWGCCRITNKIITGTASLSLSDDEADINKTILKKITKIEEQLNKLITEPNVKSV